MFKPTVISITETKQDGTIFDTEIYIKKLSPQFDVTEVKKGGGVACYIKHGHCWFSTKNVLSKNIKVIFVYFLLVKTKPISVGIVYLPPKRSNFSQLFAEILSNALNILEKEAFLLSYMQINILQDGVNLLEKKLNYF